MIDRNLVEELSEADDRLDTALALSLLAPALIADETLRVLDAAGSGTTLSQKEKNLLFWGIHVLGAARQERAFQPLMRLLRQPSDRLDALLGDALTETLPRIVAGVFDGNADELFAVIGDPKLDDFVRWELFRALAFLTQVGRIDPVATRNFLLRFDDERLAVPGEVPWEGWQEAIALLGLREMAARVETARREGRIPDDISGPGRFEGMLKQAEASPDDMARFAAERLGYIEDLLAELDWALPREDAEEGMRFDGRLPDDEAAVPVRNPLRHVGRNDPCPCGSGKKFKKCCLTVV